MADSTWYIQNPYPLTDQTHWHARLGEDCGRPEFVPCRVLCEELDQVSVQTLDTPKMSLHVKSNDLLGMDGGEQPSELGLLNYANRPNVTEAVRARFVAGHTCTFAGLKDGPLISINPACAVVGSNSSASTWSLQNMRSAWSRDNDQPLLYGALSTVTQHCLETGGARLIVFNGESGSGKSESVKAALEFMCLALNGDGTAQLSRQDASIAAARTTASLSRLSPLGSPLNPFIGGTSTPLLAAATIAEACCCAATARNANASRASLLWRVDLHRSTGLCLSGSLGVYGLEVGIIARDLKLEDPFDRNFHLLHSFAAAVRNEPDHFNDVAFIAKATPRYLRHDGETHAFADDADRHRHTRQALHAVYSSAKSIGCRSAFREIWEEGVCLAIAAVLALGNIEFSGGGEHCVSYRETVSAGERAHEAAHLLGVERDTLDDWLLTKSVEIVGSATSAKVAARPGDAERIRDALAKQLYKRLVEWIANELRVEEAPLTTSVYLLDAVGFDSRGQQGHLLDRYEELLHNYCAERRHRAFLDDMFRAEIEIYDMQGVSRPTDARLKRSDGAVLSLLGNRDAKLFGILLWIDAALRDLAETDAHLVASLVQAHRAGPWSSKLEAGRRKLAATSFVIRHSCGEITYDATDLLRRAHTYVPKRALESLANKSKHKFIRLIFSHRQDNKTMGEATVAAMDNLEQKGVPRDDRSPMHVLCCSPIKPKRVATILPKAASSPLGERPVYDEDTTTTTLLKVRQGLESACRAVFDPAYVARQLCDRFRVDVIANLVAKGWHWRMPHEAFFHFFAPVAISAGFFISLLGRAPADRAHQLLLALLFWAHLPYRAEEDGQIGATLVMLSTALGVALETVRAEVLGGPVVPGLTKLAALARGYTLRRRIAKIRTAVAQLCAGARWRLARRELRNKLAAGRVLTRQGRRCLARCRRHAIVAAANVIARWHRASKVKAKASYIVTTARQLRSLCRTFILRRRAHLYARRAASLLAFTAIAKRVAMRQKAERRAATLISALCRGVAARKCGEASLAWRHVRDFRIVSRCERATRCFQATWRAVLTMRRLRQLMRAAVTLGRWVVAKLARFRYMRARHASRMLVCLARGKLARDEAKRRLVARMVVQERLRIRLRREGEVAVLARRALDADEFEENSNPQYFCQSNQPHLDATVLRELTNRNRAGIEQGLEFSLHSPKAGTPAGFAAQRLASRFELVDVDATDVAESYEGGWAHAMEQLEASLGVIQESLVSVAIGRAHTVALTERGDLYYSDCAHRGQLGIGHSSACSQLRARSKRTSLEQRQKSSEFVVSCEAHQQPATSFTRIRIKTMAGTISANPPFRGVTRVSFASICCGADFSLALSVNGRLYSWGDNRRGQLGNCGSLGGFRRTPTPVLDALARRRVLAIACGGSHALCIAVPGIAFSWGAREACGVDAGPLAQDKAIIKTKGWRLQHDLSSPTLVRGLDRQRKRSVWKIACGNDFAIAIAVVGTRRELLGWGANNRGQLGLGDHMRRWTPVEVGSGAKVRDAIQVACGGRHSLVLLETGVVLAAGANASGQLGLGDRIDRHQHCVVSTTFKVSHIAAGWRQSVVLTTCSKLFAWGATNCVGVVDTAEIATANRFDFLLHLEGGSADRLALQAAFLAARARRDWTDFKVDVPRHAPLPGGRWRIPTKVVCAFSSTLSVIYVSRCVISVDAQPLPEGNHVQPPTKIKAAPNTTCLDEFDEALLSVPSTPNPIPAYVLQAEAILREQGNRKESLVHSFFQDTRPLFSRQLVNSIPKNRILPRDDGQTESERQLRAIAYGLQTTSDPELLARERGFSTLFKRRQSGKCTPSRDAVVPSSVTSNPNTMASSVSKSLSHPEPPEHSRCDLSTFFEPRLLLNASESKDGWAYHGLCHRPYRRHDVKPEDFGFEVAPANNIEVALDDGNYAPVLPVACSTLSSKYYFDEADQEYLDLERQINQLQERLSAHGPDRSRMAAFSHD